MFAYFVLGLVICLFQDSFCVDEEPQSELMEASALEVAEAILEAESKWKRRRRKRMRLSSGSDKSDDGEGNSGNSIKSDSVRNKKRYCRIVTLESSDSDKCHDVSIPPPEVHTHTVNSGSHKNSAEVSSVSNPEIEFVCEKSFSHGALSKESVSTKESVCKAETVEVDGAVLELDWSDWNFENFELSSSKQALEKEKKHTFTCGINETEEHSFNLSTVEAEQKRKFDSDEMEMNGTGSPILTCSGHSRTKAVRSLNAEFDKEKLLTSLCGGSETRQRTHVVPDKSVLCPPDNNSARRIPSTHELTGVSKEMQLKSYSTTSIAALEVRNYRNKAKVLDFRVSQWCEYRGWR